MSNEPTNALLHGHHSALISWGRELNERVEQIKQCKPLREIKTRLRCIQVVTPEMLADLPAPVVKTRRACYEAQRTRNETTLRDCYVEAWRAYVEADRACNESWRAYASELEAWHQRWCAALKTPEGCPWDGERLVGIGE